RRPRRVRRRARATQGRWLAAPRCRAVVGGLPGLAGPVRRGPQCDGAFLGRPAGAVDRRPVGHAACDRRGASPSGPQAIGGTGLARSHSQGGARMLWTIVLILLILWLLGGPILNLRSEERRVGKECKLAGGAGS